MLEKITFPESTFYIPQHSDAQAQPDASLESLFASALAEPIDYPTLDQFVLPGDCVAVALMGNLPQPVQAADAAIGAIASLVGDVSIVAVVSPSHRAQFDSAVQQQMIDKYDNLAIRFEIHDPTDQGSVSCIANNQAGEPVYINREMFDADVVIPLGTLLDASSVQARSYYPEFSNSEVLDRFKNPPSDVTQKQLDGEVRMAEANLGADFSILVVRGPGGNIASVHAGNSRNIRETTNSEMDSLWAIECQAEGDVVIATIEGRPDQQSWEDVFHALAAAAAASQTVAQIVICSALDCEPTNEEADVLQLQFEVDLDARCRKLGQLSGVQEVIPGILESTSVYLLSQLSQDSVEEAGLGYVESEDQIQRIVDRAESGILLRDAHLCRVAHDVPT